MQAERWLQPAAPTRPDWLLQSNRRRVKSAYQSAEAFWEDVEATRADKKPRLWWLGQSGFLLHVGGRMVLFDPYLSDSLTRKYAGTDKPHTRITERVIAPELLTGIDVITSSHNHTDHLDSETLLPLLSANPKAKLLVPRANVGFVLERLGAVEDRLVEIDSGETLRIREIEFTGIPAAHNTVDKDEAGHCRCLGYVARAGAVTLYHSGDTLMHDGLVAALNRFRFDAVLLPINGNKPERRVAGNMNGSEAAGLAKALGARLVIPHHFDMFEFNTASPHEFESECRRLNQGFRTLRNGEGMDL
jgi:L-ascorbate metabolism protein UlaG (beta-lactamase superfamily)